MTRYLFIINVDETDCSVEFNLMRNNKLLSVVEFKIIDLEDGICINQLSNCFVDIEGKIFVGNSSGEASEFQYKHILQENVYSLQTNLVISLIQYHGLRLEQMIKRM